MSDEPFDPHTFDDVEVRLDELLARTDMMPSSGYSDSLRAEVLYLIEKATSIIQFDAASKMQADQALGLLNAGNTRLALVKLRIAMDDYLTG